MKIIKELETMRFYGTDLDVRYSLFEHGLIIADLEDDEMAIIYGTQIAETPNYYVYNRFNWYFIDPSDFIENVEHLLTDDFFSFAGYEKTPETPEAIDICLLDSLIAYYGIEDVLGESYQKHKISNIVEEIKNQLKK